MAVLELNKKSGDNSGDGKYSGKEILSAVVGSLRERGYDPLTLISGYLMSGEPACIPNVNNARTLIMKVDRDLLLREMIENFLED